MAQRSGVRGLSPRTETPHPAHFARHLLPQGEKERRGMNDTPPTLTESALRGIACKWPRWGKATIYSGFRTLRPNCEACGLDFPFRDSGDGPAIFITMIAAPSSSA